MKFKYIIAVDTAYYPYIKYYKTLEAATKAYEAFSNDNIWRDSITLAEVKSFKGDEITYTDD